VSLFAVEPTNGPPDLWISEVCRSYFVHGERYIFTTSPPSCTGPFPLFYLHTEVASQRVGMNVVDRVFERFHGNDAAVISAAGLPKMPGNFSIPSARAQMSPEPSRVLLFQKRQSPCADRLFDGFQDILNPVILLLRHDHEMNVFRHDDVRPDVEIVKLSCSLYGFNEPNSRSVFAQKLVTPISAEGELVSMAGEVHAAPSVTNGSVA
jgi:hypothetical protein